MTTKVIAHVRPQRWGMLCLPGRRTRRLTRPARGNNRSLTVAAQQPLKITEPRASASGFSDFHGGRPDQNEPLHCYRQRGINDLRIAPDQIEPDRSYGQARSSTCRLYNRPSELILILLEGHSHQLPAGPYAGLLQQTL